MVWPFRRSRPQPPELVELVSARTNAAAITPAENLLAAVAVEEPFSLEIAAQDGRQWFLARTAGPEMRRHLERQLGVAYPQAELRRLDLGRFPGLDPACPAPGEQVAACALMLRGPVYLPLRTFHDPEVAGDRAPQADPVLGILGALGELPDGWRGLVQLVLRAAPDDWCRPYLRLAVEHPLATEREAARADTSLTSVYLLGGLLGTGALAVQALRWYAAGQWLELVGLSIGLGVAVAGLVWLVRRNARKTLYDVRLVQEKLSRPAYLAQLRLAVFAPAGAPPSAVRAQLERLAASYRQFTLAASNALVPRRLDLRGRDLRTLEALPGAPRAVLTTRELAGLWHLPQAQADLPLLERTTARRRLPLPEAVARGCRIGVSEHQGRAVPVALPEELLRRHLLLVAKTRRGKSSLLLRLAQHLMAPGRLGERTALVLVDPHRDLAEGALGLVPPERHADVVYLDLAQRQRPFGLNLLDTGLGWDRDRAVANTLAVFRREFETFWGPRMEDAFRFALLTLYEANAAMCAADPDAQRRQHTVLEVPAVLGDPAFRRGVLELVSDPVVKAWWQTYFEPLGHRLQTEVMNPVQTKVQRFAGSRVARGVVGQPRSTVDPAAWVREGALVVVHTAKGEVGEDTAALVGGTLLNLVALAIGGQAALGSPQRRPVALLVDEFQSLPGADYEAILSELAKYGASLVLATQSLARLQTIDRVQGRTLRATVFANLDGLFAFHTSAEDAGYLVRELGPEVDEQDLVSLGEHQCYARLSAAGERLPVFSVRLDPPPAGDPAVRDQLARASAARYGRHQAAVEADLAAALARIQRAHQGQLDAGRAGQPGGGVAHDAGDERKRRNQHRPPSQRKDGRKRDEPHQGSMFDVLGNAGNGQTGGDALHEETEPEGGSDNGRAADEEPGEEER